MINPIESKIKRLLSVRRRLEAQLKFYYNLRDYPKTSKAIPYSEVYATRLQCLIRGTDGFLLLITEEEKTVVTLHLLQHLKWDMVIEACERIWPSTTGKTPRRYKYLQQTALRKMIEHVQRYASTIDFAWLDDPLIVEFASSVDLEDE